MVQLSLNYTASVVGEDRNRLQFEKKMGAICLSSSLMPY